MQPNELIQYAHQLSEGLKPLGPLPLLVSLALIAVASRLNSSTRPLNFGN